MSTELGRWLLAVSLLAPAGCSDAPVAQPATVSVSPGGTAAAGAAGTAGQGSGGQGSAGQGSAGQGSAGSGSAGSGGSPVACSTYADDPTWSLIVQIKNEMSQTLYLGSQSSSCDAAPALFEVEDAARTPLPALPGCRTSCAAVMTTGAAACPAACAAPSTVTLEPGQTARVPWDGRYGIPQTVASHCVPAGLAGSTSCVRAERIEADAYTFLAHAGTRRQCLDPSGTCTCAPSTIGGCSATNTVIAGTIITSELFMMLEPGENALNGEPPLIAIYFRD